MHLNDLWLDKDYKSIIRTAENKGVANLDNEDLTIYDLAVTRRIQQLGLPAFTHRHNGNWIKILADYDHIIIRQGT